MPNWLVLVGDIADVAWKAAVAIATVFLTPMAFRGLRAWHTLKTAQLETERDIERQRREAAEADFDRITRTLPLLSDQNALLVARVEELSQGSEGKEPSSREFLKWLSLRLLLSTVEAELMHHNMLVGRKMSKDVPWEPAAQEPDKESGRYVTPTQGAKAFLLAQPEAYKGFHEDLLGITRRVASRLGEPDEVLLGLGKILAGIPGGNLPQLINSANERGSPVPAGMEYLMPHATETSRPPHGGSSQVRLTARAIRRGIAEED